MTLLALGNGLLLACISTPLLGVQVFMLMSIFLAFAYTLFILYRVFQRDPTPAENTEPYQQVSVQAPLTTELSALAPEHAFSSPK